MASHRRRLMIRAQCWQLRLPTAESAIMPQSLSSDLLVPEAPSLSPYITFSRAEWAKLRAATPMPLTEAEVESLKGVAEDLSMAEVEAIYLPLGRLLNLYVV